jgi:hypothetical protein
MPKPKSEQEIKVENRLKQLSQSTSLDTILPVFKKLTSETLTEDLLKQFVLLVKPAENVSTVISVFSGVAVRELGVPKALSESV